MAVQFKNIIGGVCMGCGEYIMDFLESFGVASSQDDWLSDSYVEKMTRDLKCPYCACELRKND